MDRSLKWRTLTLLGVIVVCVGILLPTVMDDDGLPSWFPFKKKINLGLDLQGGSHIVYTIDLGKALDDRASDIKRELDAKFTETKVDAKVSTPDLSIGAVTIAPKDPAKRADILAQIKADYTDSVDERECTASEGNGAICIRVASRVADQIKRSALDHAVQTIRERIDEKGVAEPSVVQKDDQIIVELPGLDEELKAQTRDLIARSAKLEFKVVDNNADYMTKLYAQVEQDPKAKALGIEALTDVWSPDGGGQQRDFYLIASDRKELLTHADAIKSRCVTKKQKVTLKDGKLECDIKGRDVIKNYIDSLGASFKIPDDRRLAFEYVTPFRDPSDKETKNREAYWRSYYIESAIRLTGSAIQDVQGSYDPETNQPVVIIDFNRYGSRVFGDLTAGIVGKKLAAILDDKIASAPTINGAIPGGRALVTMGGGDARHKETERDLFVNVLRTGSLPAPLREESVSEVGPSLGRDAIDKTWVSFSIGVVLVIVIMVGIYKWSGWIAVFALVFHNLLTLALMTLFGATLTLPGIAAIVLSVGMCVDGNILIYERIRDELQLGKSVRGAVDLGFTRAFSAILDGQMTTAAGGWVLLQYGSGPIKGFAVMLLVGIFTTITTNTWVTRVFFDWYIAKKKGQLATISI